MGSADGSAEGTMDGVIVGVTVVGISVVSAVGLKVGKLEGKAVPGIALTRVYPSRRQGITAEYPSTVGFPILSVQA